MPILFLSHLVSFSIKQKSAVKKNLLSLILKEKKKAGNISFTFCDDTFLLAVNKKFLKHNTLTDIITFQYPTKELSSDIFISIPRVKENAKKFKTTFETELYRVMIHGILHLCGYKDKTYINKKEMRKREDYYLRYFEKM
jgi:probable rRNA maturation factor